MPSTFLGLNTGTSGLNYYQSALNTTAHNISNANTKGYSRQEVLRQASDALRLNSTAGMQGTGVTITGIQQIRNSYYDTKYWSNTSTQQEYQTKYDYSYEIENYFNEMSSKTGYTALMNNLTNSMKDLADDPSNSTTRVQYINDLSSFTKLFNEIANNLQKTQKSTNDEVAIRVGEINSIAQQIYSLNQQINNIEIRGGNANDLRDKRVVLVDQLSELANVDVQETDRVSSDGLANTKATNYVVRINGEVLVDDLSCKQLMVVPRDQKANQTDINGLYDVYWKNSDNTPGEQFDTSSSTLTGKLQGLIAIRDGNGGQGFGGLVENTGTDAAGTYVTLSSSNAFRINDLMLDSSSAITIGGKRYYYDSFEAKCDATTGDITSYTFRGLKQVNEDGYKESVPASDIQIGYTARVSQDVNFEGVPYYMNKLNTFVRTFSQTINSLCTAGVDANGDKGLDMLNTVDTAGNPYSLSDTVGMTSFQSNGASYYRLNALNWGVNKEIVNDPNKVVVSDKKAIDQNDVEDHGILDKIQDCLTDTSVFKQGTPSQYLESVVSVLGVNTSKCKIFAEHQKNIVSSVDTQRLSESSVDENEEAADLVRLQNGYNLSCKVVSIMDEIYNKLINEMGV